MAEAGERRSGLRRGPGAAGKSGEARLVQERRAGGATSPGAGAAGGLLFPESPHGEGPADRLRGAVPPRQRRAAGADQLARRHLAKGPARVRRYHGELSLPPRGHREEPRSLRQPGRGDRLQRREKTAEDRRPAAAGYAAVVGTSTSPPSQYSCFLIKASLDSE